MAVDQTPVRPSWFPDRLDWFPGEAEEQIGFTIREAAFTDRSSIKALCRSAGVKPNDRTILRWMTQHGYTVRLAVRNSRHIAAVCVSKHSPSSSKILVCYVHPEYRHRRLEQRLLLLASLELPESPLEWVINPSDDEGRADRLQAYGWVFKDNEVDDDGKEHPRYVRPAYVGRGDTATGEGDSA